MDDMILMMSAAMSAESLVEMLEKDIEKYKLSSSEDKQKNFDSLQITCLLIVTKRVVPTLKDVTKVSEQMKQHRSMLDFLNGGNNKN